MFICNAPGCDTRENRKIDGKNLTLFSFPTYDNLLTKQWEENSKAMKKIDENDGQLKLCELHFESHHFISEEKNALAPGAVPTIFELNGKRKLEEEEEEERKPDETQESSSKRGKLKENKKDVENIKAESELGEKNVERKSEPKIVEDGGNDVDENKKGEAESRVSNKELDIVEKKIYRLIIRIDKVIGDGKKNEEEDNDKDDIKTIEKDDDKSKELKLLKKSDKLIAKNVKGVVIKPCTKTGCKLIKTMLNKKPVFKCDRCSKYYIVKENSNNNREKIKNWKCYICQESSSTPDSLALHIRKHFTCDMCQVHCSTQISYDKHLRMHVSTDPLLPYKCHKCATTFEVKSEVKKHCEDEHPRNVKQDYANNKKQSSENVLYRCEYCYAVFKKEKSYKSHVELHMGNGEFDCALCTKKFKTAKHLATHQSKHLGTAVKYTCKICEKIFSSLEAVECHMKSHMESEKIREKEEGGEERQHKCSVCQKMFKNESTLNNHMREHLSRAHRCPKCNKAFINETTLRIHFKTHATSIPTSRDMISKKKHACTLCPNTFDSRSQLYNHIMTHLEQMHGIESGDVVFEGINQLLESEGDTVVNT